MGMEYARLYFDFFTSEKTQFLLDECGDHGVLCLIRLWIRAGQRNNDGVFKKTGRAIEKVAGWKGKKGKLIEVLTDPDFLFLETVSESEFLLHNWENNNPHLSEKAVELRTERARRAGLASAEARKKTSTTSQLQVNSESTHSQLNPTKLQLGSTNVTKGNVTEGKIIKEKKDKKKEKNVIELPDWLDKNAWAEWEQHRKDIKKPQTALSRKKQLKVLSENKERQAEIIDRAINCGWTGLFGPKTEIDHEAKANKIGETFDEIKRNAGLT